MSWRYPLTKVEVPESDVEAVIDCLRSGWLTMGPRIRELESAFADWTGGGRAVAVSSGTASLHLACRAVGLQPGDEVIVPALTFLATANAPRYCGAEPVLCDSVSAADFNLDPADVERRITPRTRAVIAVHFCGYAADVVALRELCDAHGIALIEDAAQAVGAVVDADGRQAGTVGDAGCFSFFSKKQLCVGEGGMVVSAREDVEASVRSLRSHAMTSGTWDRHRGHDDSYDIVDIGFNFRMDEPRAALALARLPRLGAEIDARRRAVEAYRERLSGVAGIELCFDAQAVERSSHFAYPVLAPDVDTREALKQGLADRGVQTTRYPALHTLTEYARYAAPGSLPAAEAAADRHLALPLWPGMTDDEVGEVVEDVRAVMAALPVTTR